MVAKASAAFVAAIVSVCTALPAGAAGIRHTSEYSVSLGILPVARMSFASEFNEKSYTINGSFRSAGLVDVIAKTSAETTVKGSMGNDRLQANSYTLVYTTKKKTQTYDVQYRNGNVVSTTVKPEPKARPASWVPIGDGDLRAVLDPLSGMIFPADAKICPGRLPIYDGESRLDLVLTAKGTEKFSTSGFKGDAIVCSIRYVPKSGYRKGRKDIEYLKTVSMEVWFAKADGANVYAPVYAYIPTRMGPLYVKATKYGG
ncbi:DUF3108 domain-containing protein [Neorhizobium sp. NPDC001467]|uniref:DUF3108 domain-containing protein n=1 Tax=Neorhizobium sp. NPDC001467 TaxID=3390595 RepID=UPI003D069328